MNRYIDYSQFDEELQMVLRGVGLQMHETKEEMEKVMIKLQKLSGGVLLCYSKCSISGSQKSMFPDTFMRIFGA